MKLRERIARGIVRRYEAQKIDRDEAETRLSILNIPAVNIKFLLDNSVLDTPDDTE